MSDYDLHTDKDRLHRDEDILRRLYHGERLTMAEVADAVNATQTTVRRWMDKFGIERRELSEAQVQYSELLDESWLREKYHDEGLSISEVSELVGCSRMPVYHALERFDIETHSRGYKQRIAGASFRMHQQGYPIAYSTYYDDQGKQHMDEVRIHRLVAVAEHGFDAVSDKVVHHKNGIPWDNRPDNLEIMEKKDHVKHHFEERGGLREWQGD